jgi:hypothetical protein
MSLTVIYIFKNREAERVYKSLDSLRLQTNKNFNIVFIDYGSDTVLDLKKYSDVHYVYLDIKKQPWNKSKAINYAVKNLVQTSYCFIADIDMIFHQDFIETAVSLTKNHDCFYFSVAYLKQNILDKNKLFNPINFIKISNHEATGMTVFKTEILRQINGFDEFFHFWGSEDTDIHNRIKNLGYNVYFFNEKTLMLHQWHKSHIASENNKLTVNLRLSNITRLNQTKSFYNKSYKLVKVNDTWGEIKANSHLEAITPIEVPTYKSHIDLWLNYKIHKLNPGEQLALKFYLPSEVLSLKYRIKKTLGKNVLNFYNLKEVNDLLLLQIITHLHTKPYSVEVSKNLDYIVFRIENI